ncbi:hypothetical protein [Paraburkholderia sp. MM5384-R2]|uniref:hypothetical protein n=1 Tax=Paraburkholderia sp. MM5384-R2 TaxID=2723097 RepID=UPI0016158939|nr:hypothetical protein [Paraburkholderia sp. MM5384-R2]
MTASHARGAALPAPPRSDLPPSSRSAPGGVRIGIDIQRLSLNGYTQVQQQRFVQALEATLSRLAEDGAGDASLSSRHIAQLEPLRMRPGSTPEDAARLLAQALIGALAERKPERGHG